MTQVAEEKVWQALSRVIEPDFKKDLVTLKMIENLKIEDGKVSFTIVPHKLLDDAMEHGTAPDERSSRGDEKRHRHAGNAV